MSNLGLDFHCDDDITEDWAVAASPELAFMQALYRRLQITGLFYNEDYGTRLLESMLETGLTVSDIKARITTEFLKDERVQKVAFVESGNELIVKVTPYGQDVPFDRVISIDRVAQTLELI